MHSAVIKLSAQEKHLMERYGGKCAQKTVYLCKGFRYENLKDALRYTEINTQRDRKNALPGTS